MPRTYLVSALGCKVNQYEAQQIREALESLGLRRAADGQEPEIVVLNTCAVTRTAAHKSRQSVRHHARSGRSRVIVVGCGPAADREGFERLDGVSAVLAHTDDLAAQLAAIVNPGDVTTDRHTLSTFAKKTVSAADGCPIDRNARAQTTPETSPGAGASPSARASIKTKAPEGREVKWDLRGTIHHFADHQRAFLKVQDGCDAGCTYCIVPKLRPQLKSKPIDLAVREAEALVAAGHREIVVTGICLGAYGRPTCIKGIRRPTPSRGAAGWAPLETTAAPSPLAELIESLARVHGLERIRLSSLEPGDMSEDLLTVMARNRACVPHLHLPLQAGSDRLLRRMNRRYRIADYLATIDRVNGVFDRPAITTDIIVGFPGETEEEFEQTLRIVERVGFARVHAFPFSLRAGTAAEKWQSERLPRRVAQDRVRRLQTLADQTADAFRRLFIGRTERVIVESCGPEGWMGRTDRYFPVVFSAPPAPDLRGRVAQVVVRRVCDGQVRGELTTIQDTSRFVNADCPPAGS